MRSVLLLLWVRRNDGLSPLRFQEVAPALRQFANHETHFGMCGFKVGFEAEAGERFAADRADGNY
jgi:hypothetical protein